METIIQQMAIELVERVLKNLRENGISNIGQAAKELQSIANAAEKSMEKAAKDVGAAVSKQTVNNKVLALKEAAAEYLPNVHFVMDGFHLQKYLRKLGRLEGAAHYMGAIRRAIRKDAFEKFVSYCAAIDEKQDEQGHEKLMELVHYFENNWEAIVMRMQNEVCGSCTESLVSHVLSARLSRNPLAWSEHGIDQMAMLRVYTKTGGVVTAKDIRVSRSKADSKHEKNARTNGYAKYRAYAEKQMDAALNSKLDWGIFEKLHSYSGKLDGITMLLKAYGAYHDAFASA